MNARPAPRLRSPTRQPDALRTSSSSLLQEPLPENEGFRFRILPQQPCPPGSPSPALLGPPPDLARWVQVLLGGDESAGSHHFAPRPTRKARLRLLGAEPPWEGNDQGQCWGRSICSNAFAPFFSVWSLLLSTDQLPAGSGRRQNG